MLQAFMKEAAVIINELQEFLKDRMWNESQAVAAADPLVLRAAVAKRKTEALATKWAIRLQVAAKVSDIKFSFKQKYFRINVHDGAALERVVQVLVSVRRKFL
jgi:hypothetical protein